VWLDPEQQKTVGESLASFRKRSQLTQNQLASKLGKPQSFVSAYEAGQRRVDLLEMLKIAEAMHADPHEILTDIIRRQSVRK
jgi:transcriptional regulator with XRE-family HTH domain